VPNAIKREYCELLWWPLRQFVASGLACSE
jgi:hypothetical protein